MSARNLRVILIDDALKTCDHAAGRLAHKRLDLAGYIDTWRAALKYWSGPAIGQPPDIVLADVLFRDDATSPLKRIAERLIIPEEQINEPNPIPTGLLHLKAFAVVARCTGRPVGIGLHTRNPDLWKVAWDLAPKHPMGPIAAHEIGELAAILMDPEIYGLVENDEPVVAYCWDWLRRYSRQEAEDVLPLALADYRRKLLRAVAPDSGAPDLLLLPGDHMRLMVWVDQQRADPKPIPENLGLPLVSAHSGLIDEIRLVSLFAEVDASDPTAAYWLSREPLPANCYATDPDPANNDPADLVATWPQLGRFLARLGTLARVARHACDILDRFPLSRTDDNPIETALKDVITQRGFPAPDLIHVVAFLFQAVNYEYERYLDWQSKLRNGTWDTDGCRFVSGEGGIVGGESLNGLLRRMLAALRSYVDAQGSKGDSGSGSVVFDLGEVKSLTRGERKSAGWCLDRLIDGGYLQRPSDEDAYAFATDAPRDFDSRRLPVPSDRIPKNLGLSYDAHTTLELKAMLLDSFGYGVRFVRTPRRQPNENTWCDAVVRAFGLSKRDEGRAYFLKVLEGEGPSWLYALMADYARGHLQWLHKTSWPVWFQGRPRC